MKSSRENNKNSDTNTNVYEPPPWSRIRLLSVKLRSLGYLIGTQAEEDPPIDIDEVYWGVGMLLEAVAKDLREISTQMEVDEMGLNRKLRKKV